MKKARPSFDVAREALDERRDAWVYRSDVPPSPAAALETPAGPPEGTAVLAADAAGDVAERSASGWIEAGVGVMTLPLTVTAMAFIAPALWICGARARR